MMDKSQIPLGSIMTKNVVTLTSVDMVSRVDEAFKLHPFHHLPVVEDGKLVGMVSSSDLERVSHGMTLFQSMNKKTHDEVLYRSLRVKDIMVSDVFALDIDDVLHSAMEAFKGGQFRAIPITEGNNLVGIITPMDLARYLYSCA